MTDIGRLWYTCVQVTIEIGPMVRGGSRIMQLGDMYVHVCGFYI